MPVIGDLSLMNWNSVILVGVLVLTEIWWLAYGVKHYPGPKLAGVYTQNVRYDAQTRQ